ncbi:MAG: hypothetical protein H6605_08500 [Flavobacteriales bacterium]|nr:hypothetical protein [Flavobacteriales bacterium]
MDRESLSGLVAQLLYTHNCVIIPHFGGFVTNVKQSGFEDGKTLIFPNRKRVAFNKNLNQDDGLLVNALAAGLKISYEESLKKVEAITQELFWEIENNSSVSFGSLGTFYSNFEKNLIFLPQQNLNFSKESFGLEPLKLRLLTAVPSGVKIITHDEPQKAGQKEEPSVSGKTNKQRTVSINFRPYIAAAILLIIGLAGILQFENFKNKIGHQDPKAEEHNASILSGDSNIAEPEIMEPEGVDAPSEKLSESEPIVQEEFKNPVIDQATYSVLYGNYPNEETAHLKLDQFKVLFNGSRVKHLDEGKYAIYITTFYKNTSAEEFCVILRQMGYSNVFILEELNPSF